MVKNSSRWDLSRKIILLNQSQDDKDGCDEIRCLIEQMGGRVAYAKPRIENGSFYGARSFQATHEYVAANGSPTTALPVITEQDFKDKTAAARQDFMALLSKHVRRAHVPVLSITQQPGRESRYFGDPWMPDGMEWPTQDGVPMRFVLQLDTKTLPESATNLGVGVVPGLLLFFHGEAYDEDTQSLLALVDSSTPGNLRPCPDNAKGSTALAITDWIEVEDYPFGESKDNMPAFERFDGLEESFLSTRTGMALDEDGVERKEKEIVSHNIKAVGHTFNCDKLGGWPYWGQGDETPKDSKGKKMNFLMQVGNEGLHQGEFDRNTIDWPTFGRGHVFVSPKTGEFKYIWACD